MGPRVVIIKKGEHGSMMYNANGDCFLLPAYPASVVIDPTGAGDSFAGGLMGYLASAEQVDVISLRNAMVYGTVVASFTIGDFSVHGVKNATRQAIDERFDHLRKMTQF
jgi:cytidine kinase